MVKLQPDTGMFERQAVWDLIKATPAVESIVDLAAIDWTTLETILRPPSPELERLYRKAKAKRR